MATSLNACVFRPLVMLLVLAIGVPAAGQTRTRDDETSLCWEVESWPLSGVHFNTSLGRSHIETFSAGPSDRRCKTLSTCFESLVTGLTQNTKPHPDAFRRWGFQFNAEPRPERVRSQYAPWPHDCQYHPEHFTGVSQPGQYLWAGCGLGWEYWSTAFLPQPCPYTPDIESGIGPSPRDPLNCIPFTGSSHGDPNAVFSCVANPMDCRVGLVARNHGGISKCTRYKDLYTRPEICPREGDLSPLSGLLQKSLPSDFELGSNVVMLTFDDAADPSQYPPLDEAGDLGDRWFISTHRRANVAGLNTTVVRGNGEMVVFTEPDAGPQHARTSSGHVDTLTETPGGLLYRSQTDQTLETFDSAGRLTGWVTREGSRFTTAVDGGLLLAVRDEAGRGLHFSYRTAGTRRRPVLERISSADGSQSLVARYDGAFLTRLERNDGSAQQFVYAGPRLGRIIDENDAGHQSYGYETAGLLTSSELGDGVERREVAHQRGPQPRIREIYDAPSDTVYRYHEWEVPQGTSVTQPNRSSTEYTFTAIAAGPRRAQRVRLTGVSQPAGAGCGPASSHIEYDLDGNVRSRDDFNGHRTCYAHDALRNLELVRVEGLARGADCASVLTPGAVLPQGARKIVTDWHPDWDIAVRKAEPGKLTTWRFNGQPEGPNGVATCAPATALLPDGKPIAVLCARVEQATTDLSGAQGFEATRSTTAARRSSYTYDASGRMLTEDGPRTDVADVTTYAYYDTSSADFRPGDLKSITDAVGKTTRHTRYDAAGRLLETIAPNGLVTTYTYDSRGQQRTQTVGARTTTTTWNAAGLPIRVTHPDGSWQATSYDSAHRVVGTTDSKGTSVELKLDSAGNVTSRTVRRSGAVREQTSWVYDALGRVARMVFGGSPPGGLEGAAGGAAGGGATAGGMAPGGGATSGGTAGGGAPLSCTATSTNRREQVCQRWRCDRENLTTGTWSGSAAQCLVGDMPESRSNALKLTNLYRFLADLPPVVTSAERNDGAQECALMMTANNATNFSPPPTWACHTQRGAMAASQSLMCSGTGAVRCVDLQMTDFGSTSSNTLGGRRWVLSNDLGTIGIGSTSTHSCHWVVGSGGNAGKAWVAWPPPGPVPLAALRRAGTPSVDQIGWSIQGYSAAVTNATVRVTDNGQELPVTVSNLLAFYGSPSALKFVPNGWAVQAGHTYEVTVSGGSLAAPIAYSVEVLDCP